MGRNKTNQDDGNMPNAKYDGQVKQIDPCVICGSRFPVFEKLKHSPYFITGTKMDSQEAVLLYYVHTRNPTTFTRDWNVKGELSVNPTTWLGLGVGGGKGGKVEKTETFQFSVVAAKLMKTLDDRTPR